VKALLQNVNRKNAELSAAAIFSGKLKAISCEFWTSDPQAFRADYSFELAA
jgi:hypothetical protein